MAKVTANLADVKTKMEPAPEADYEMIVKSVEVDETGNDYTIVSAIDEEGEHKGKQVWDRFNLVLKSGEGSNRYALAQLKRYYEAITGEERANASDLDTDELLNGRFRGYVVIDAWTSTTKKNADGSPKSGRTNKLTQILPL